MVGTMRGERRTNDSAGRVLGWALLLLAAAAIFGSPLWRGECPAYRDAGHFYYPTLRDTSERWASGSPPLWNPYDNLGQPLAADATSIVFYPLRVLLHLPFSFERNLTLFTAVHWLLAAIGARRLAKRFAENVETQFFAALLYAMGGYVAWQCFNLVFLIGAAWLPWAWERWESLRVSRDPRRAGQLGMLLGLMVLGGDPQLAYHVALLALLDSVSWRRTLRDAASSILEPSLAPDSPRLTRLTWPWFRSRWMVLAIACAMGLGFAAVQVAPSATWSVRTSRAIYEEPRSIWEWIARTSEAEGPHANLSSITAPPARNTHDENLYDFSFAPIRLLEFAAPGIFGELGPYYQNWLRAMAPRVRWWTPTNYLGLFTLVAAALAIRAQWSSRLVRSAAFVVVISVVSSFGVWGLGALWNNALRLDEGKGLNPALGGLYWIWVTFLPAYSSFRYPSKWLVIASLAIAMLAARGLDWLFPSTSAASAEEASRRERCLQNLPHCFTILACLATFAWLGLLLCGPKPFAEWGKLPAHGLYGPFDVEGALRCVRFAFARLFAVSLLLSLLLFSAKVLPGAAVRRAVIAATLLELFLAVWSGPVFSSRAYWMSAADLQENIAPELNRDVRLYRASMSRLQPPHWRTTQDAERREEVAQWERRTLFPRYHWLAKIATVESRGTAISADHAALLDFLHRCPPDDLAEPAWTGRYHPYDLLAAGYYLVRQDAKLRDATPVDSPAAASVGAALWRREPTPPRVWIAASASLLPELRDSRRSAIAKRTSQVLLRGGEFRDLSVEALVECDAPDPLLSEICRAGRRPQEEQPILVSDAPERVEISAKLDRPGLLVLADSFDPGWIAVRVGANGESTALPIYRVNRVLRGVCLPAGEHRVIFSYRPWEIRWGGVLSGVWWCFALPLLLLRRRRGSASSPLQDEK